jgi:hypothetical protein
MVSNTGGRAGTAGRVEFIFWLAMVERRRDKRNPAAKAVRTPQFLSAPLSTGVFLCSNLRDRSVAAHFISA